MTFKPQINMTSEIIVESDPKRGNENLDDKMIRLYMQDHKKNEVIKELKTNEVYGNYTFKPEINKVSKALAEDQRRELLEKGMSNYQAKDKFNQRHEAYLAEKDANCTFKPEIYSANLRKFDAVPSTVGPDGPLDS